MNKLFLIDAYALIFRFYYAFIARPMRNADGVNTSAIYGFTKFINDLIERERPGHIAVAFDPRGGNFRNRMYSLYKANRSATPEDIIASVPFIKSILAAMKIPVLEVLDYEADDVIGTLAKRAAAHGLDVYMVTPDKDYGQLIEDNIKMYKPRKGGADVFEIVTKESICKYYSINDPTRVIDILALWGDASDNVPGIPGIGEKSAIKLISAYDNIEGIYENIDKIKGKQRESLLEFKDRLMLARELVTICLNVPLEVTYEELKHEPFDRCELIEIYRKLGFATMIHDLERNCTAAHSMRMGIENQSVSPKPSDDGQLSLFDEPFTRPEITQKITPTESNSGEMLDMFSTQESNSSVNNIENTPHTYTTILTQQDADLLADLIEMRREFCFDTETTGLNPMSDRMVGLSIALESHKAYYIPNNGSVDFSKRFKKIFESEQIAKIGQNIKFDMLVLKNIGVEVRGTLYDTMIMQYLLDPDASNGMDYMARNYLSYETIKIEELIGRGVKQLTMDLLPIDKVAKYAAEDADITLQLKEILWQKVVAQGFEELYMKMEEPIIKVLADMEFCGVKIDNNILEEYSVLLEEELALIEYKIREIAGAEVNINSPKQLGELLFDKLKISDKAKKTKTKQYKTDEEYLQSLADKHPVVGMILEYRAVKKLLSTYVLALPQLINSRSGRVHTTYNQALTRTGRLSSNNPNLQNIPIRNPRSEMIRKAFVAGKEDSVIVAADYSQIELRIMAHLSADESMIEAFRSGEDIHTSTAAKIYSVDAKNVTKIERGNAKSANFGIIYGISSFGLAANLKISRGEANELIDGYFRSYPAVKRYMEQSVERAREKGYAETIFNRRRHLSDIYSQNANIRSFAERNAINAPIQGSAADIMKIAMIALHKSLRDNSLNSKIIMQVHDELVLEVEKSELDRVIQLTKDAMEGAVQLSVDLTADVRYADNWFDAH